jgi:MFS transporter, DHA2 family, multidrug resistance protein
LVLTSRLIQDPPYFKRRKLSETRIDYIGLGLVALGLGALQVVLDKGQRDDWFESNFILWLTVVSAAALIFVVFWEWYHKDPIIDLHLFRERSFAAANFLMFMLGFALLGSTLLLPLFMQTLLGYTAERSGMALSPGGFAIMIAMPIVGFLLSKYSPRWLMLFGLLMLSFSLFHMTTFDLSVDFRTVMLARVYQAVGLAFLFVPINTAAYSSLPREKNNAASGLMNLARNIGGSVGISFVTTGLARRAQFHQVRLTENFNAANPVFRSRLDGMTSNFLSGGAGPGSGPGSAAQHAYALMQSNVIREATMLAYIDNFWILGIVIACLIPFVFLIKKPKQGGEIVAH